MHLAAALTLKLIRQQKPQWRSASVYLNKELKTISKVTTTTTTTGPILVHLLNASPLLHGLISPSAILLILFHSSPEKSLVFQQHSRLCPWMGMSAMSENNWTQSEWKSWRMSVWLHSRWSHICRHQTYLPPNTTLQRNWWDNSICIPWKHLCCHHPVRYQNAEFPQLQFLCRHNISGLSLIFQHYLLLLQALCPTGNNNVTLPCLVVRNHAVQTSPPLTGRTSHWDTTTKPFSVFFFLLPLLRSNRLDRHNEQTNFLHQPWL